MEDLSVCNRWWKLKEEKRALLLHPSKPRDTGSPTASLVEWNSFNIKPKSSSFSHSAFLQDISVSCSMIPLFFQGPNLEIHLRYVCFVNRRWSSLFLSQPALFSAPAPWFSARSLPSSLVGGPCVFAHWSTTFLFQVSADRVLTRPCLYIYIFCIPW